MSVKVSFAHPEPLPVVAANAEKIAELLGLTDWDIQVVVLDLYIPGARACVFPHRDERRAVIFIGIDGATRPLVWCHEFVHLLDVGDDEDPNTSAVSDKTCDSVAKMMVKFFDFPVVDMLKDRLNRGTFE